MNRWTPVFTVLLFLTDNSLRAQISLPQSITISGSGCANSVLSVTTPVPAQEIVWTQNGTTVVGRNTAVQQTSATTVAGQAGIAGAGADMLNLPDRLFVDDIGNVYVPDMGNNRVQKWAPGAVSGVTVAGGKGAGAAANQLNKPSSVFVDKQGNIYVADQQNNRVMKWAPGATTGVAVTSPQPELSDPTDIFIDKQGNLYVSSQFASCVLKYAPGSTTGTVVAGVTGVYDAGPAHLGSPTGIFVDDAGFLYVCDTDYGMIKKFTPGSTTGIIVAQYLVNPIDIYVDCAGNMYIVDIGSWMVVKWPPGATYGTYILGTGRPGPTPYELDSPVGIFMDGNYNIYVSDYGNARIQKFSSDIDRTYTATTEGTYTATVNTGCGSITSNAITIVPPQTALVGIKVDSKLLCDGSPVSFSASATYGGNNPSFQWKKNGVDVGTNAATYVDDTPADGDIISCVLTSDYGCLTSPEAVSNAITIPEAPSPELGGNLTVCPGTVVQINAHAGYLSYTWQDGSTDSIYTAYGAGTYYVDVLTACRGKLSDTVHISIDPLSTNFLPVDTSACVYDKTVLRSSVVFESYNWSTGSAAATITTGQAGWYWLQGIDKQGCISTDSVLISPKPCPPIGVYVPEAFSPNGDGRNDIFRPIIYGNVTNYQFSVFNRQGQLVFTSREPNKGWDGRINGQTQETNVYAWFCSYQFAGQPERVEKGTVTLIR
jgi:gliding motility-associated-like protein